MADIKKTGPDGPPKPNPASVALDEESMTEADLDQVIAEADPDFAKSISEIGNDKNLSLSQIDLTDAQQALHEEQEKWAHSGRVGRTFYRLMPFLPVLSIKTRKVKIVISDFLRAEWVRTKNFLYFLATDGKKKTIGRLKTAIDRALENLDEGQRQFKYMNWKMKLAAVGIGIFSLLTIFIIFKSFTKGLVHVQDELFIPTLERVATEAYDYDPETEVEPFYENLRAPQNIIMIPKTVVNLKQSAHSGPNPMGAFEFFIEGVSPEVAIEIKDREIEIRDRIHRTLEELSFDQVDSPEGKKMTCEKVQKEVNAMLTTGKIKRVWLKTVIVKP